MECVRTFSAQSHRYRKTNFTSKLFSATIMAAQFIMSFYGTVQSMQSNITTTSDLPPFNCSLSKMPWIATTENGYEKTQPPLPMDNLNELVDVHMLPKVQRVDDVDEVREEVSISMSGFVIWKDTRLQWNVDVCNAAHYFVPVKQVWVPVIEIVELHEFVHNLVVDNWVKVARDGTVTMFISTKAAVVKCHLDAWRFPFDNQECRLTMWTYTWENLIDAWDFYNVSDLQVVEEFGEWHDIRFKRLSAGARHTDVLVPNSMSLRTMGDNITWQYSLVQYKLQMSRKYVQHLLVWYLPLKLMTVVGLAGVFGADGNLVDSGNIIIVMSLFLMALVDRLPAGFSRVPVMVLNYTVTFCLYGLAVVAANSIWTPDSLFRRLLRCIILSFQRRQRRAQLAKYASKSASTDASSATALNNNKSIKNLLAVTKPASTNGIVSSTPPVIIRIHDDNNNDVVNSHKQKEEKEKNESSDDDDDEKEGRVSRSPCQCQCVRGVDFDPEFLHHDDEHQIKHGEEEVQPLSTRRRKQSHFRDEEGAEGEASKLNSSKNKARARLQRRTSIFYRDEKLLMTRLCAVFFIVVQIVFDVICLGLWLL